MLTTVEPAAQNPAAARPALRQPGGLRRGTTLASRAVPAMRLAITLLAPALLAACVYRMPIRQGNYLDPTVVAQVRPGMTHSQVRFLLGTPMVPGGFDDARWDYDYYLDEGHLKRKQRAHVTVYFTKNVVARVTSDVRSAPVTTVTHGGIKYPVAF